jgi:hypothetical protein
MNKTLHADKLSSVNFYVQVPNGVRNLIGLSGLMSMGPPIPPQLLGRLSPL